MRTAIIKRQKGLEDFLNFVRDEGAVGSNPAIPILLKSTAEAPCCTFRWTIHFIERRSRYWVSTIAGHKDELLFQRGTQQAW